MGVRNMRRRAWTRGRTIAAAVLALVVGVPVGIAVAHEGFPATDVRPHSRDVWVTNADGARAGRLNARIQELDASVGLASSDVGVLQDGDRVFLHDQTGGSLARVDPGYTDLSERVIVPPGSRSAMGGDVIAVVDPVDGRVFTIDARAPLAFDAASAEPAMRLGPGGQVVVTPKGTVVGLDPREGTIERLRADGGHEAPEPLRDADGRAATGLVDVELTAVGERAAVLDRTANAVYLESSRGVAIDEPAARIQLASPEAGPVPDAVVVATASGLVAVPFGGGAPRPVGEAGAGATPTGPASAQAGAADPRGVARPAVVLSCAFGAWRATGDALRACPGAAPERTAIPGSVTGDLVYRVNRDVVALNDTKSGNVWLGQERMRLVENWRDTVPPKDQQGTDGENEATEQSFEDTLAERSETNHPPQLQPDSIGVRAGTSTYAPVLDNDADPDGDLITITGIEGTIPESVGRLRVIDQGRALQFDASPTASGEFTVRYTGDDGREGGTAQTELTIRVVPASAPNLDPVSHRRATVTVEAGQQTTYGVLDDWSDPEGDPLHLVSATAPAGLSASFTPDGRITVTSLGAELGERTVSYVVSDGHGQATGELRVEVAAPGTLAPVATPDYARGAPGVPIVLDPLVNDQSPSGARLTLVEASEIGAAAGTTRLNADLGTVAFQSDRPGSHYVQYTVAAGGTQSKGLIRFDVVEPSAERAPPIAVRDVVYVRPGQPSVAHVLANDSAEADVVLSVQSVETTDAARAAGLNVELLDNAVVRLSSASMLPEPVELSYTITDGGASDTGRIVVVPVEPLVQHHQPIGVDDSRRVRAGDYASVDVLENDVHPDDASMRLGPVLGDLDIGDGFAFVAGDEVRFKAPTTPGTYSLAYQIVDEHGEQGGARVVFTVTADDEVSNRPPEPATQVARVFEGASILVQVPLTGVDPDGDSVEITGMPAAPSLGAVRDVTPTSFVYEAFPGASGTDVVRYTVVDRYGQQAEGVVRIGVVARPGATAPPVAVDDLVHARPGTRLAVPVLVNDSDPNGYPIRIDDDLSAVDPALHPEVDGSSLIVDVPGDVPSFSVPYTITNDHGGTASAYVHATVSADAPPREPTARDHTVLREDVDRALGEGGDGTVVVDVRQGATNPVGRVGDLVVTLAGGGAGAGSGADDGGATVAGDGRVVVRPGAARQVVAYTLTVPETGQTASGFVLVPARLTDASKRQSPTLRPDLPAQTTRVGQAMRWNVGDLVVAPSGNPVTIISPETAWAEQGDGSPVATGATTLQFVPKPGFRGPASITFTVTDAQGSNDAKAGVATVRLQITVGDPDMRDVPPTFVTPQASVEAGGTATVDLAAATGHPNPKLVPTVAYSQLTGGAPQVKATLQGSTARITADRQAKVGDVVVFGVTYTMGSFVQQGTIRVTVTSTTKPPPRATPDTALTLRGQPVLVDVLANDFNPFPESRLRLLEVRETSSSPTGASIAIVDGKARVVPGDDFIGEIAVTYRIGDDTNDPRREATGLAIVRVRDVPSAPTRVALETTGAGQLTASWDPSASNGEPVSDYEVLLTAVGSGQPPTSVHVGTTTSHTFSGGIVPGRSYSATVRAYNAIGAGPLSEPSSTVRPVDKPSAPQNVAVSSGYTAMGSTTGELVVTWSPPAATGGELTGYRVTILSPESAKAQFSVPPDQTSYTMRGLRTSGTSAEFSVTVTAVNDRGSETSNPASGTLTYMPKPSIALSQGGPGPTPDPMHPEQTHRFHVKGEQFMPELTYVAHCWAGDRGATGPDGYREAARQTVGGAELNAGLDLENCTLAGGSYRVVVTRADTGEQVAESNEVKKWTA